MSTVSALTTHCKLETQERLPLSTPTLDSSKSNITTKEQPDITNTPSSDIRLSHFMNSIYELRNFSTALSAFISRYDELRHLLNFIESSIDSKLPKNLVDTTNPNQSALPHLLETSFDQAINVFPEVIVSEQNPKEIASDWERGYEIARTPERTNFSHNSEEADGSKKPEIVDVSKNPEEIDVFKKQADIYTSKAIDVSNKLVEIDVLKNIEEIDLSKKHAETDASKNTEEIDTLTKPEETVPETSRDQVITAIAEAIVSEQNPKGLASNCEQSDENVRTPENLEEIDVSKKPEVIHTLKMPEETVPEANRMPDNSEQSHEKVRTTEKLEELDVSKKPEEVDISKKPEEIFVLNKHEQTDICKNPAETDVLQKPEEIVASMNPEEINALKKHEETRLFDKHVKTGILEKHEETSILQKHEETRIFKKAQEINASRRPEETEKTSKKFIVSVLEFLCKDMKAKIMKKHVATHYSEMSKLHKEIANALKLAKDPAKLVLSSIGRFFVQSSSAFCKVSDLNNQKLGRMAAVLILECFVMISSDGIKIAKRDQEYAAKAAFDWRNRMIREGGLGHTDEVDARGLLLLISGFGIPDHVFKIQDIMDLIMASNVQGISTALCRSVFLIPKLPEVIYLMVMNDLEIEAVDIAYIFCLEDMCHPHTILKRYLHKKIKDIQNDSSFQMLEGMKQQLFYLKSAKRCLESHNMDPSMLLPDFKINEKIQDLEKEINDLKLIQKRKSLENPNYHEAKRARFSHENMPRQQQSVGHYGMSPYYRSRQPSTSHVDFDQNLRKSCITNHSASSVYNAPATPENIPYGGHGPYDQRYSKHGQTYDLPPYGRPWGQGTPESFPGFLDFPPSGGFPGRQGPSSDLYGFADMV